jgi:hypothetical protein
MLEYHLAIIYMLEHVVMARETVREQETHQTEFFVKYWRRAPLLCSQERNTLMIL